MQARLSGRARLVMPLDVRDLVEADALFASLRDPDGALAVGVWKVGLELFTAAGPEAVKRVHDAGAPCFLDLKLHDIPETMVRATEAAAHLGVRYLTVHASAGPKALARVAAAVRGSGLQLLAVTALTSLDDAEVAQIGVPRTAGAWAEDLAALALDAGIDGLVCSPHECAALRRRGGASATLVVPGVRPAGAAAGDQKRVATPTDAIRAGASLLVVGRPIRDAADRRAAADAIADEIAAALA